MKKCKVCGADFEGNFCPFCGTKASEVCPICGAEKIIGGNFCNMCGYKFEHIEHIEHIETPQEPARTDVKVRQAESCSPVQNCPNSDLTQGNEIVEPLAEKKQKIRILQYLPAAAATLFATMLLLFMLCPAIEIMGMSFKNVYYLVSQDVGQFLNVFSEENIITVKVAAIGLTVVGGVGMLFAALRLYLSWLRPFGKMLGTAIAQYSLFLLAFAFSITGIAGINSVATASAGSGFVLIVILSIFSAIICAGYAFFKKTSFYERHKQIELALISNVERERRMISVNKTAFPKYLPALTTLAFAIVCSIWYAINPFRPYIAAENVHDIPIEGVVFLPMAVAVVAVVLAIIRFLKADRIPFRKSFFAIDFVLALFAMFGFLPSVVNNFDGGGISFEYVSVCILFGLCGMYFLFLIFEIILLARVAKLGGYGKIPTGGKRRKSRFAIIASTISAVIVVSFCVIPAASVSGYYVFNSEIVSNVGVGMNQVEVLDVLGDPFMVNSEGENYPIKFSEANAAPITGFVYVSKNGQKELSKMLEIFKSMSSSSSVGNGPDNYAAQLAEIGLQLSDKKIKLINIEFENFSVASVSFNNAVDFNNKRPKELKRVDIEKKPNGTVVYEAFLTDGSFESAPLKNYGLLNFFDNIKYIEWQGIFGTYRAEVEASILS